MTVRNWFNSQATILDHLMLMQLPTPEKSAIEDLAQTVRKAIIESGLQDAKQRLNVLGNEEIVNSLHNLLEAYSLVFDEKQRTTIVNALSLNMLVSVLCDLGYRSGDANSISAQ